MLTVAVLLAVNLAAAAHLEGRTVVTRTSDGSLIICGVLPAALYGDAYLLGKLIGAAAGAVPRQGAS